MNRELLNIANMVTLNLQEIQGVELMGGKMGTAVFYYELSRFTGIKTYNDIADNLLDEVLDGIEKVEGNSIDRGFAGIGWGINHLIRNVFVEADKDILIDLEYHIFSKESVNFDTDFSTLSPALYLLSKPERKSLLDEYDSKVSVLLNTCKYYFLSIYDSKKKPLDLVNSMLYFLIELEKQNSHPDEVSRLIWRILSYLSNYEAESDLFGDSVVLLNLLKQLAGPVSLKERVLDKFYNISHSNWNMAAYRKILWQQILFSQYNDALMPDVPKLLDIATKEKQGMKELMVPLGLYLMNVHKPA